MAKKTIDQTSECRMTYRGHTIRVSPGNCAVTFGDEALLFVGSSIQDAMHAIDEVTDEEDVSEVLERPYLWDLEFTNDVLR